ncbi:hypothetical protein WJX72_004537 [[Myrmecia] bisecta]|uniref:Uncharacterized protein n=1 Tax=[Myrmecia] bisecta TaxID=41462 RepID=A0AAW1R5V3_9CHLO
MSGSTCTAPSRNDQDQEFYINFGRAVRTLREDIALFFHKPADMSIFTEDIGFIDNISSRIGIAAPIRVTGKEAYRRHLWSLRFHAGIIFSRSEVNILRLWQRTPQSVSVRWTIRCYPRLLNGVVGSVVYLDGVSEYKFNSKGLIYEHSVDILNWDGLRMGLKKRGQQVALVPTPF